RGLAQQRDGGAAGGRLGRGREERAEGDVVGAGRHRLARQRQRVVAGGSEDGVRPERRARLPQRTVVLAEVGAVRADVGGQPPVVVHDQGHAVRATGAEQGQGLFASQVRTRLLV